MAKLPGWIAIDPKSNWRPSADGKSVEFTIRVRRWHPAFWWIVFQIVVLRRDPLTKKADR